MAVYRDPVDGSSYDLDQPRWRSDAGRPLWIEPGSGLTPADLNHSADSIWRYQAALPLAISKPISIGEGKTPLVAHEWHTAQHPFFKLDYLNPTGSFKDRGTSVMLSYLRDRGITSVVEDSSGNGGASVAGYGAAGGLSVKILAPASTSPGKIAQVHAFGAEVQLVEGPREASQDEAIRQANNDVFYASHNWQAFFLQGTKTLAYELWEDLGFQAPDQVIVPVGAGSSLLGCWLGFSELLAAQQIEQMPQLFAAQPLNCSPVDASFTANTTQPVQREIRATIAEGTSIARPLRLAQMVEALRDTSGGSVAITESEIVEALQQLCRRGLFVEPTSALAAAAYTKLVDQGTIRGSDQTVILLSGSGLKSASTIASLLASSGHRDI
ncbi:threonine synthase [Enteractinococcus helveticum]|uniref:Pyridoxal-5'-phosphate-dependent protein subunit beta n=1 Tax=Enteractinococcus helveticum TaxID=1837282 RepID=A0A1B7LY78_9MICC|nr:threonine synthase [Enteractinococcus helveticum]OAV60256.1 pyridoxal-5'-phosphate-dependent protein subunit beta [Enteractinococcus helveticum]